MQEIPYSKIRQWFQEDRYQEQSESAYGDPQEQLLKFYNMLESCGDLTTVLDLGCGDGRNTIALARRGYHVTGIDVAGEQALLYRARQESLENVRFITGDLTLYPFDKESYDCVLCACVLHLLSAEQIEVVACKAKKALRQGGLIYLDVLTNIKRTFRDSGEEFTYTGLVNWSDRQAQDFFTRLFSNWSVLDMFSFHEEGDWPVQPGNDPIPPYHYSEDYVCVIAQNTADE
ncbi:SAM-dependent methyltransferase [Okeania sp. KiyG1]|nr:SAM-dependent methyltransferase [Okeania sp. KiyG1]